MRTKFRFLNKKLNQISNSNKITLFGQIVSALNHINNSIFYLLFYLNKTAKVIHKTANIYKILYLFYTMFCLPLFKEYIRGLFFTR